MAYLESLGDEHLSNVNWLTEEVTQARKSLTHSSHYSDSSKRYVHIL